MQIKVKHVHTKLKTMPMPKRSHRVCLNFAITEATKGGTSSLKRFLKKPLEPRNTSASKKLNGVIMLPW